MFARGLAVFAGLAASPLAFGQLVVGNSDTAGPEIRLFDLGGVASPRLLVSGTPVSSLTIGLDTDNVTPVLYWAKSTTTRTLSKGGLTPSGLLSPVTVVGPLSTTMRGMAWDSTNNQLAVTTFSTIGTLDRSTAAYSSSFSQARLDGLAYDAGTDSYYALLSTSGYLDGTGLYHINQPWSAPTFTKIAELPGNGDSGIRGLAFGDGRLFLTRQSDDMIHPYMYVYNLASGVYEQGVAQPSFTSNVGGFYSPAVWAPQLYSPPNGTNLVVTMGASEECTRGPGDTMVFSVHVGNFGDTASGPVQVVVDLPPGGDAMFAGSFPAPTTATATQLTYQLPSLPAFGASSFADITINLTVLAPAATMTVSATASTTSDIDLASNAASAVTTSQPAHPATADAEAIVTSLSASSTSLVPGGGGVRITDFTRPFSSPDGSHWVLKCTTNDASTSNQILLHSSGGGAPSVVMQTGVTNTPNGLMTAIDIGAHVNDSGVIAFTGTTNAANATNGIVGTLNGATVTEIAREGSPVPAVPGLNYGQLLGNSGIFSNNSVFLGTNNSGNIAFLSNNGNTLIAQGGVTQPVGASMPINADQGLMPIGVSGQIGFTMDPSGAHSIYQASLNLPSNPFTPLIVVDNTVVVQGDSTVLPGNASPVVSFSTYAIRMTTGGRWIAGATQQDAPDFVILGTGPSIGTVIQPGDALYPGSAEHWAEIADPNPAFPKAFSYLTIGDNGHYVIAGNTDNADDALARVLVFDSALVLARTNDPVDIDGNGMFDDGYYIRSFNQSAIVGDAVLVVVSLRDAKAALCGINDADAGVALLRIPLPNLCPADFNGVNGVTVQDIFDFLTAWLAGSPSADFNGVNGVTVQDIFDFLTAWLAGC